MSILQFLRIFWARWLTVAIATATAAFGALVVAELVPPRYEAVARVLLSLAKPDPVTGQSVGMRGAAPYIDAQREMVRDYRVTGRVVDALGWTSDPGLIRAYQARPATDTRDFRRWLAQRVVDHTAASFKSTILEIRYSSSSPVEAKVGAETLRQAYLDESLADRRQNAKKTAEWFNVQAESARKAAETAEIAKANYEKESGIVLADNDQDIDSARLASLAAAMSVPSPTVAMGASAASLQMAQVEAQIAQQGKILGPNHPQMIQLKQQREQLARVLAQERAAAGGINNSAAVGRALEQQKAKVIAQRDKVERLRQLQAEVELRRDEYKRTAARAAQLSLEAAVADTGSEPLGPVVAPTRPIFPNKPLMVGGAAALGAALGLALSLLLELINRRVRGVEDLNVAADIRCIGVLEEPGARRRNALRKAIKSLLPRRVRMAT